MNKIVWKQGELAALLFLKSHIVKLYQTRDRFVIHISKYLACWNLAIEIELLIRRAPDTSKVRSKMVYASSKDRFKRELDGIQVELQATDLSEMSMDIVKERAIWRRRIKQYILLEYFLLTTTSMINFHVLLSYGRVRVAI